LREMGKITGWNDVGGGAGPKKSHRSEASRNLNFGLQLSNK